MNAAQQQMVMYLQTQMVAAMQQRPTTSKSQAKDGPSFQDLMNKKAQDAPKDEAPPKTEDSQPTDKTEAPADPSQDPALDPYRQQLLAAAQAAAAAVTIQIVDTAPQQTAQPTVQTVQTAAPIQPQAETPQAPVAQQPILPQQPAAQPVQTQPAQTQPTQPQQTQQLETAIQTQGKPQVQTRPTAPRQDVPTQGADAAQTKVDQPLEAVRIQPKGQVTDAPQTELKPQEIEVAVTRPQTKGEQVVTAQAQSEAPVFAKVETTPIKVGEAPVLDTETGDVEVQLAKQVDGLLQKGGDRVELRLNPEHLGAVTVQLTRSEDGSIQVTINASSSKATELLERHASGLEQLLAGTSRAPVQVEVQRSQDSQHAGQQQQQQPQERESGAGQHQQQRQPQSEQNRSQDFMQQLRLGLVGIDEAAS